MLRSYICMHGYNCYCTFTISSWRYYMTATGTTEIEQALALLSNSSIASRKKFKYCLLRDEHTAWHLRLVSEENIPYRLLYLSLLFNLKPQSILYAVAISMASGAGRLSEDSVDGGHHIKFIQGYLNGSLLAGQEAASIFTQNHRLLYWCNYSYKCSMTYKPTAMTFVSCWKIRVILIRKSNMPAEL